MTRHEICEEARHTRCRHCAAPPGCDCDCGPGGVCLCRITRARVRRRRITLSDFASVIDDGLAEAGGVGIVLDPGAAA